MKTPKRFIVIDDDPICVMICKTMIKEALSKLDIQIFNGAESGLAYIKNEYAKNDDYISTVLFLDINMPTFNGWQFLESFEKLGKKIKEQIKIYMLSSSIDDRDISKAKSDLNVVDYISKPITVKKVLQIIMNVASGCAFREMIPTQPIIIPSHAA